jgi:hypothetical protein
MDSAQRKLIAQGFVDLANLIAAALVVGQFVSGSSFHGYVFAAGLFLTITLYLVGIIFAQEQSK